MNKLEWQRKRIEDLQVLLDLVSHGTIRLREDVGQGMTDITDRSVESWDRQIAELRKAIEDDINAQGTEGSETPR
jgi:hypothetical protein